MSSEKISIEYIALDCKGLAPQIDTSGVQYKKTDHQPVHFLTYTYVFYGYIA